MSADTVLSLSFDPDKVKLREVAIGADGFEVVSVYSHSQARHEIQMGTCGILVTCDSVPDEVNWDVMNLFKSYCPNGLIISVLRHEYSLQSPDEPRPDIRVPESQDPDGLVQALRAVAQRRKKAS
ncbi:MAG TPA: hypothetical protein VIL63_12915 [Terriglobales bacterium]